jgi:hypothetical protein
MSHDHLSERLILGTNYCAGPAVKAKLPSLVDAAITLRDTAAELERNRFDLFLLDWANAPASHEDVAAGMRKFTEFANDQYQDVVALFTALSASLKSSVAEYGGVDRESAEQISAFLNGSTERPAEQRDR